MSPPKLSAYFNGYGEYYTICCVKAICQKYWSFAIHSLIAREQFRIWSKNAVKGQKIERNI